MVEPSEKYKDLDFLIGRVGMPVVMCAGLLWFMAHEFSAFKREMVWDLQRSIRNERAIMQKLGIPVVLDSEKHDKDN